MIPLPRVLHQGLHGSDVTAIKRGLRHYEVERDRKVWLKWPPNDQFNDHTRHAVAQFQHFHALEQDGVVGPMTYAALYPWLVKDGWAIVLLKDAQPVLHTRGAVKVELDYWINHKAQVHYSQWRPIPLYRFRQHLGPIYSDCSGSIIGCFFGAGCPDPSGNSYNGQGWTGDFLTHLRHIDRGAIRVGDIIIFGYYPGMHAVAVLMPGPDPLVYSHGHEGVPDDPRAMPLSFMEGYFHSLGVYGETYLSSGLP